MTTPVSLFPPLLPLEPGQDYVSMMDSVYRIYQSKYTNYQQIIEKLGQLIQDWTSHHTQLKNKEIVPMPTKEELLQEFDGPEGGKLDTYIAYRNIREDLKEILASYDSVIQKCPKAPLDVYTLTVLQKVGINLGEAPDACDELARNLEAIKKQREDFHKMYEDLTPQISQLELALEPLAYLCSDSNGFALPLPLTWLVGQARYVAAAIDKRIEDQKKAEQEKLS